MLQKVRTRIAGLIPKRVNREGVRAAVAVSDTEIAVAVVRKIGDERPKVLRCFVESAPQGFQDPVLKKILTQFDLRKIPVSAVIGASDYQLAQVQAPDVPAEELRAAARYSMRDAFDFPIDNAVLDVFDLPEQASSRSKRMLFAVATRGDAVQQLTSACERSFPKFDVIDIPELCQRNLSALLPQDKKGVAFLMIRDDFAQLVLTRGGHLYVTRRFEFGLRNELGLGDESGDEDSEAAQLPLDPQMLSLELQRSLDFYESHFDEGAIGDLIIAPAGAQANLFAAELGQSTGLRIGMFNLFDLVDVSFTAEIPDGWLPCMAIGAALRTRPATKSKPKAKVG
jgi:MSHA biogenesis protein MshI